MTTHCADCSRIKRVCAIREVVSRREAMYVKAHLDCGHHASFVTTAQQLAEFREAKRLISEVRIDT